MAEMATLIKEVRHETIVERDDMQAKMDRMRVELTPMPPAAAISEGELVTLQLRVEALHVEQLLSDDERDVLEDLIADLIDLQASVGAITLEMAHKPTYAVAGKVHRMLMLSKGVAMDRAFARQLRRKFVGS
jgi:hypothetical protein